MEYLTRKLTYSIEKCFIEHTKDYFKYIHDLLSAHGKIFKNYV